MTAVREQRHRVAADHPCLAGHFPGRPLVPGVLILDRVRQTAAARLREVSDVKFVSPLLPEQTFIVTVTIDADADDTGARRARFRCTFADDGRALAKGRLLLESA